jgi:hypothetical protein
MARPATFRPAGGRPARPAGGPADAGGPPVVGVVRGVRDDLALLDAAARVEALGVFQRVVVGAGPDQWTVPNGLRKVAWLWQMEWSESDQVGPVELGRKVAFALAIGVRHVDPTARYRAVCRLDALCCNALNGESLGGFCWGAYTLMGPGRDQPAAGEPNAVRIVRGEFAYPVPGYDGLDGADDTDV